mgnify:CR=1 FL=1
MNKKYFIASSLVAFAVLLTGVLATNAAFRDGEGRGSGLNLDPDKKAEMQEKMEERKAEMETRQTEMQEIMESGDYNAWKVLHEERESNRLNILDIINEDNFDKMVEMHNLRQAGDYEGARNIADELGLPEGMGRGMGQKTGMHRGTRGNGGCQLQNN